MRFILLMLLLTGCARFRSSSSCEACYIIERHGDEALETLKTMSPAQLSLKGNDGYTPFYWAIYHEAKQVRNLLVEKIPRKQLLQEPIHKDLITVCAGAPRCSSNTLQVLATMGFKVDSKALGSSILNGETCSTDKFDTLINLKATRRDKDKHRNNLLHQIIDRGVQGRPKAPRECLVHAIKRLRKLAPVLMGEKNAAKQTPRQYGEMMLADPEKWGSGIVPADVAILVKALK